MKQLTLTIIALLGICCCALGEATQEDPIDRVTISQLTDHLYIVTCTGGEEFGLPPYGTNLVASVGPDGILLVDAGFGSTGPLLKDTLATLGNGDIRLVINTHSHGDHAFGNRFFSDNSVIIGHHNVVRRMSGRYFHLQEVPSPNRPMVGFDDSLVINFNGEKIRVVHTPDCHSSGDVYVHFTGSNVVAAGDLFFSDEIPYIELGDHGTVSAYHDQVKSFIADFPDDVTYVASHGRTYGKEDLRQYDDMLAATIAVVRDAAAAGKTAENMIADSLLKDWTAWNGQFATTTLEAWIQTISTDLQGIPQAKPSVCEPLTLTMQSGTAQDAMRQYRQLKTAQPDTYDYGEAQLNMLGYQLLFRNRVDDALGIFRLNVEEFPSSFNVYDSYGEALLASGDTAQSIVNYEKSLELNPENVNAAQILKNLR